MTMKKLICFLLTAMLLTAGCALGENAPDADILQQLENQSFIFSSGAGAWRTILILGENGAFSGEYTDSDMGDAGEGYPNGTVYGCLFHGVLAQPERVNEHEWKLKLASLEMDEGQVPEAIENGIRYITAEPYGLINASEVILYLPGTPLDSLPEGFLPWAHLTGIDLHAGVLPYYALWNETDACGFITDPVNEEKAKALGIANPWRQVTAEEMREMTGASFGLPQGVEWAEYFVMDAAGLSEMQFLLDGRRYIARIQETGIYFTDISGMNFTWQSESAFNLAGCAGIYKTAQDEEKVHLLLWHDAASGTMYSLAVQANDLSEPDLFSAAQAVYHSAQGESGE